MVTTIDDLCTHRIVTPLGFDEKGFGFLQCHECDALVACTLITSLKGSRIKIKRIKEDVKS